MPGFEHERAVLSELQAWAKAHGALCTYNGRSFDVPLIETRFMFHRVPCPLDGVPHLDMLHAARRLWRQRPLTTGTPDPDDSSCSLAVLEKHIAGLHRVGDVPGYEIPSRFFKFVRSGDARPLEAVMEHNRLDLISLAAVLARAIVLITRGPVGGGHGAGSVRAGARLRARRRARQRGSGAAAGRSSSRSASAPSPKCTAKRCAAWRGFAAAIAGRMKPRRRGTSWRCCRDAPRRCAAKRRKRSRSTTSIASRICRRRGSTRSICSPKASPIRARVQHRLDRLERKLARYTEAMLPLKV